MRGIIFLPIFLAVLIAPVFAVFALDGWDYYREVTITNNVAQDLTDYQVNFTLDTANLIAQGKMRSDCGDIRVTLSDGQTLLPYWIESWSNTTCNRNTTKIWTKVPLIPASASTVIQVWYGNSSATSMANGGAVFEYFDDFDTLNTTYWDSIGGTSVGVTSGYLRLYYGTGTPWYAGVAHTFPSAQNNLSFTVLWRNLGSDPSTVSDPDRGGLGLQAAGIGTAAGITVYTDIIRFCVNNALVSSINIGSNYNVWRKLEIQMSGTNVNMLVDDVLYYSASNYNPSSYPVNSVALSIAGYNHEEHADWFFIRKYTFPEPSTIVSAELIPGLQIPDAVRVKVQYLDTGAISYYSIPIVINLHPHRIGDLQSGN